MLVKGLPPGGALHRAIDPDGHGWSTKEELLAIMIEVLDHGNRLFFSANRAKGARMPDPIRIRRPWERSEDAKPRPKPTHAQVKRFFGGGR